MVKYFAGAYELKGNYSPPSWGILLDTVIGLDVPANDDRRVVLAPVKVRCSQSSSCVDGPRKQGFFAFCVGSLAVMCPAFDRGRDRWP